MYLKKGSSRSKTVKFLQYVLQSFRPSTVKIRIRYVNTACIASVYIRYKPTLTIWSYLTSDQTEPQDYKPPPPPPPRILVWMRLASVKAVYQPSCMIQYYLCVRPLEALLYGWVGMHRNRKHQWLGSFMTWEAFMSPPATRLKLS